MKFEKGKEYTSNFGGKFECVNSSGGFIIKMLPEGYTSNDGLTYKYKINDTMSFDTDGSHMFSNITLKEVKGRRLQDLERVDLSDLITFEMHPINDLTSNWTFKRFVPEEKYVAEQKLRLDTQDNLAVADETIATLEALIEKLAKQNQDLKFKNAVLQIKVSELSLGINVQQPFVNPFRKPNENRPDTVGVPYTQTWCDINKIHLS